MTCTYVLHVLSVGVADTNYSAPMRQYGESGDVHEKAPSRFGLVDLLGSWERSLRAKQLSPRTIADYLKDANILAGWLASVGMPTDPASITREHLEAFILAELDRGLAASTVATTYRRLQALFRWLKTEDEIVSNPMTNMTAPAFRSGPVPVVKADKLKKLVAVCEGTDFHQRRDMAIVRLFFDTGIRLGEMAAIKLAHIDWDDEELPVEGKGGKTRIVPFGARTAQALDRYVRVRSRHRAAGLPWLWVGNKGQFTRKGIAGMVGRRAEEAGIGHLHPHMARHTNAHNWRSADGGEDDLMELMGWSSRAMLGRYGKSAAAERARDAHKRMALGDDY